MNPPDPLLSSFDPARANTIPSPSPPASHSAFNEPLSLDDIASIKSYLKCTSHSNSASVDLATYNLLIDIDNNHLLPLFQHAIEHQDIPCVLKFASLLVHHKLCRALQQSDTILPSQNGFREGFYTNNNAFILRTIIDKAHSWKETIYAAFVNISNMFPSTNQSSVRPWHRRPALVLPRLGLSERSSRLGRMRRYGIVPILVRGA
ncbi:hypothetical protein EV368DRAFT_42337 [Lentinula lateritia]|nr:hypothetical protein EV368DRAFT_42337 [Lentinula lateritia]